MVFRISSRGGNKVKGPSAGERRLGDTTPMFCHTKRTNSEGAPVPRALKALGNATNASILRTFRSRSLNRLWWRSAATGALAVSAARTQMLPLAEGAEATIARTMEHALRVEPSKLIKADLVGRVLPAKDATTLPAMVAALKEAEGLLAGRGGANRGGAVGLPVVASNGASDWRQWGLVVDALHIFVADIVRGRCGAAVIGKGSTSSPTIARRCVGRVDPGWGLAGRLLGLSQRSGDTDRGSRLVDALVTVDGQVRSTRRRG